MRGGKKKLFADKYRWNICCDNAKQIVINFYLFIYIYILESFFFLFKQFWDWIKLLVMKMVIWQLINIHNKH